MLDRDRLTEGGLGVVVKVEGRELLVVMSRGEVYAVANMCTHSTLWLDHARVHAETNELVCPWHLGRFDLATGAATLAPCIRSIETFPVEIRADGIFITMPTDIRPTDSRRSERNEIDMSTSNPEPAPIATARRGGGGGGDADAGPGIELLLPPELARAVATRLEQAVSERVVERIWERDPALWGEPDGAAATNLAWLDVADRMEPRAEELVAMRDALIEDGVTDAVLIADLGAVVGPEVIALSFGPREHGLRLHTAELDDEAAITALRPELEADRTAFVLADDGQLPEAWVDRYSRLLEDSQSDRFIVITDLGSELAARAQRDGVRALFSTEGAALGSQSVLDVFGLVPAALAGAPVDALLRRCRVAQEACSPASTVEANIGLRIGVAVGELARLGRGSMKLAVSRPIDSFGMWAAQLVAETIGRRDARITAAPARIAAGSASHASDDFLIYMRHGNHPSATLDASVEGLVAAGEPVLRQVTYNAAGLGRLFYVYQFAMAVAGWVMAQE